ncbi:MAG: alpha/beta hydrolase [Alphaproteobacteria bacterium]|nr:alpha/beta hydrolase [Alphaproteobacteria bacterium]MBQ7660407.1 alpha/beta hydrolase [Alphaproteobacteria bacterium]
MVEVLFNGTVGRLEGRYHKSERLNAPVALVLHPHPQYGGTMNNKVVYTLFSCFKDLGFSVLRFNFRGVGRSVGQFEDGPGELADATAALDFLQRDNPDSKQCWIAGYSFGAWIAMQLLMRRPDINNFISVSPPANEKDFAFLAPCPTSGLIIQGGKDEIDNPELVTQLARRLNMQRHADVDYALIEEGDHMYNNHLVDLYKVAGNYILDIINHRRPPRQKVFTPEEEAMMLEAEALMDEDDDEEF